MENLQAVIEEENAVAEMCGCSNDELLSLETLTEDQAQRLWRQLESNLSPENLTCDGELSHSQVARRFKLYTAAQKELLSTGKVKA